MRIFMDTTEVGRVAQTLYEIAERITQNATRLRQEMNTLNSVWYGPSVHKYMSQQETLLQRLQRHPARLHELATRLEGEIQEYIAVSSQLD